MMKYTTVHRQNLMSTIINLHYVCRLFQKMNRPFSGFISCGVHVVIDLAGYNCLSVVCCVLEVNTYSHMPNVILQR